MMNRGRERAIATDSKGSKPIEGEPHNLNEVSIKRTERIATISNKSNAEFRIFLIFRETFPNFYDFSNFDIKNSKIIIVNHNTGQRGKKGKSEL